MATPGEPNSVFISYSHDSAQHSSRVRALAERLRRDDFQCRLDQDHDAPPEGWPRWSARQIREAQFVIVVCTEEYYRRAVGMADPGVGRGTIWEGHLIYEELYFAYTMNTRFVPVLLAGAQYECIPEPLRAATFFRADDDEGYRALVRRLRNEPGAATTRAPAVSRKIWLVPLAHNPFFCGREDVLAALYERLSAPDAGVQALSGLGGVGKSQIAAEYAYRHRADYDAVFWVSANSEASLELGFAAIAENIGRPGARSRATLIQRVGQWMQNNARWLLVLDDVDDPELVGGFLPSMPAGHVLLTSRVDPLDAALVQQPIDVSEMPRQEALDFLLARTRRTRSLPGGEHEAASELVVALGGLPLALEQAGAYLLKTRSSFADYLASYRATRLQVLEKRGPIQGKYPHSVATTWTLNLARVNEDAASADLLRLSALLHPENIPLELFMQGRAELGPALETALDPPSPLALNEVLAPLLHHSLIRRDIGARTFSLHPLLQEVVRSSLSNTERRDGRTRLIRALARVFPSPEALYSEWRDCDAFVPHVQACVEQVADVPEAGTDLLTHAGFYLTQRARYSAAESLLRAAIDTAETLGDAGHARWALALDRLGWLHFRCERFESAEALFRRALDLGVQVHGPRSLEVCHSTSHLASLYDKLERWDDAHALYEQILAIGREILAPNDQAFGIWLANRAVHWERRGRYERAIECGEPARAILELHMGSSHPLLAKSVENLGWMQIGLSDFAAAEALFRRALDMREQLFGADSPEAARSRATLGNLFARSGHGDAEAEYGRALTILDAVLPPSHPDLVTILLELGDYYANGRSDANADRMYERAIRSHELAFGPHHPKLAAVLDRHASVLRRLGRNPEAKALDSRAIAIRRLEIPVKDEQARAVEPR